MSSLTVLISLKYFRFNVEKISDWNVVLDLSVGQLSVSSKDTVEDPFVDEVTKIGVLNLSFKFIVLILFEVNHR